MRKRAERPRDVLGQLLHRNRTSKNQPRVNQEPGVLTIGLSPLQGWSRLRWSDIEGRLRARGRIGASSVSRRPAIAFFEDFVDFLGNLGLEGLHRVAWVSAGEKDKPRGRIGGPCTVSAERIPQKA